MGGRSDMLVCCLCVVFAGIVYKGLWAGQSVAVKKLKHGTRRHVDEFVNECLILGKLRHPVRK